MIPYFDLPPIIIDFPHFISSKVLVIAPFRLLNFLAIVMAYFSIRSSARRRGIDPVVAWELIGFVGIPGLLGTTVLGPLLYSPESVWRHGWRYYSRFSDLSSFGGYLAGAVAFYVYIKISKPKDWRTIADITAHGLVVAVLFCRLACSIAHDHLGGITTFPLAINFSDGPRHDLGFYEFIALILFIYPISIFISRSRAAPLVQTAAILAAYSIVRFGIEYLRAGDTQYLGHTPAQYGSIVVGVIAVWLYSNRPAKPAADAAYYSSGSSG